MAESWHIPRASLGSNSSSGGHSRRSSLEEINQYKHRSGSRNRAFQGDGSTSSGSIRSERPLRGRVSDDQRQRSSHNTKSRLEELKGRFDEFNTARQGGESRVPKRGSRSSQGSTDSNHSSHSASSGSLLLTAANLENFAKIHHRIEPHRTRIEEEDFDTVQPVRGIYNSNILMHATRTLDKRVPPMSDDSITVDIPPDVFERQLGKTKDFDSVSMASSTHFTVVNGIGRQPKVPKSGLCDRGHQITVLIVTMSVVFMIGIIAAVYFMEMRAMKMSS